MTSQAGIIYNFSIPSTPSYK